MDYPKTRKMGVIVEPHVAEMHEEPLEEMGPDDVVLKMETCNICTTDYQQWMGLRNHQGFPMAGGHEWSGIIAAKGENVDCFEVGDRVGMVATRCGECFMCRSGRQSCCSTRYARKPVDGYYGNRFFSNYKVTNKNAIMRVSKDIPAAEAGFIEPVSTAVSGMKKLRVKPAETVVVIGAGTMGLVNAQVAKAFGARVIITELMPKKLERAREMNIGTVIDAKNEDPVEAVKKLTDGAGTDAVIVAVGNTIAYKQGYQMLKQMEGRFLLFAAGYPKPEMEIDPNEIHYRRLEIIGTMSADVSDFRDAGFMISNGIVDCSYSLEGKTFPLRDIQKAYEAASTPGAYRVTVDLQDV